MLNSRKIVPAAFAIVLLTGVASSTAHAWDHDRHSRVDVDIDSLKAELYGHHGRWQLNVRYDVEIEDARRFERFELVLLVTERGRPLRDRLGRPLEIVIPLDHPTDIDDDELEFKRGLTVRLPNGAFFNPKKLQIRAEIVRVQDGRVLDRKKKSVKYRRTRYLPRPPIFPPIFPPHHPPHHRP